MKEKELLLYDKIGKKKVRNHFMRRRCKIFKIKKGNICTLSKTIGTDFKCVISFL